MKQFSKDLGNVSLAPKGKWSREQEYEKLALVYNACDNLSYVAKINVPSGIDIENREYWQPMNATGYADNNFINLTAENENGTITAYETLEEAVATILPINRRPGATLSFYNLNADRLDRQAEFELWQFNSTDLANWEIRDYWNNIYYNWNVFAGWYVGADGLKNHVKIPNVGQYAYVGTNLNDALLYQCRTNGTWTNTGIKVRNYMSIVVSGNITIGENGNWFSDGEDTGIPATPTVDEQLDNIIMQLQQHATEIDKLQRQDVTLKSNIDSNFETINNKIDNIKTATDNKIDTADANLQNQITSNDTDIATLNTKHESLSRTVQGIAATGGASTATNVTYDNDSSRLNAENTQDAIDEISNKIIYDVSARNGGVVFESLSALLSSDNLNTLIPTSVRHGGMSIRFIQGSVSSSDNKYVQYRLMSDTFNTTLDNWQGVDDEPTEGSNNLVKSSGIKTYIDKYSRFISFGSGLTDDVKNWLVSNIAEYYIIDTNYNTNRTYKALYVMLNHSALNGRDYLGFQIGIYDNGALIHQYNYTLKADSLSPNTLYKVQPQGLYPEFYIRTASSYSWLSSENLCAGELFEFLAAAKGNGVQPFVGNIVNNAVNDGVVTAENNIKRTFVVASQGDLQDSELALFSDFYVCATYDIPVGKILVINYIGFNNINLGGTNALGFQLSLKDKTSGDITQETNFVLYNANNLQAGTLYAFSVKDRTDLGKKINLYFRTSSTFVWPSTDALRSCQIHITEYGGFGKNIQAFIREATRKNVIITVGKDATKYDYTSLTSATNDAPDGSTIVVYPGIYENECVTAGTTKTLYIIGIDRDKCIIKNNLGDYQYAVIHISSGLLRNLTIIQEATTTTNNGAYGVHIDFNTGYNSTLRIENCHLQSNVPNTGGAGIGLRGGMHLTFKGCRLVSGTSGRALYLHDNDQDQFVGLQNFTMEDCIIESPDQAIIIQGQGKPNRDFSVQQFYIEFCRNIIKGTILFTNWYHDHGTITEDDFQGVKNLRLVDTSWGNSADVLNANL